MISSTGASVGIYLDGAQIGVQNGPPNLLDMTGTFFGVALETGWAAGGTGWTYFNGSLDEIAIYPHGLTAAQVKTHFQARSIGKAVKSEYQYPRARAEDGGCNRPGRSEPSN